MDIDLSGLLLVRARECEQAICTAFGCHCRALHCCKGGISIELLAT